MNTRLPEPPDGMSFDDVQLFFVGVLPGDAERGLAPAYHHRILVNDADVGHINFKVGNSPHVRRYAGHVGFNVKAVYRGNGYARKACRALTPLVLEHFEEVILTTDPENVPSIRTIEGLGARFLETVSVPVDDPQYAAGSRMKRRYAWRPRAPIEAAVPPFAEAAIAG